MKPSEVYEKQTGVRAMYRENAALRERVRVLEEALAAIEQRANERHSGEHERDVVYAMFYIAKQALTGAGKEER